MSNWAIVAIPDEHEAVWKYSSEKVPHMTLLFLGEQSQDNVDLPRVLDYISHVAKTTMHPFGMSVSHRGPLGDDEADVLFFEKDKHGKAMITQVRDYLLKDPGIKKMYDSTQQYPEWTPHLTMGYPKTPAKKDDRDYPGYFYIQFDRIALWTDDYAGPEFRLEGRDFEESDMAMSDKVDSFFAHYGVLGMKWGRRKAGDPPADVTVVGTPGKRIKTSGGQGQPAHEDAIKVAISKQKAKVSTVDSLSTDDLQKMVTRMNLEQQYSKLSVNNQSTMKKGTTMVKNLLETKKTIDTAMNDPFVKSMVNDFVSKIK